MKTLYNNFILFTSLIAIYKIFIYNYIGEFMYTIEKNTENKIEIKNSKFITILVKINTNNDVPKVLEKIKKEYPNANHYCYAYIVDNYKKCSDDGEPAKTAGTPILNILDSNNLTNILAVVVRYFGGTLLGVGGLTRAYSKSTKEALKTANIMELIEGINIDIYFKYEYEQEINYLIKNENIIKKDYNEIIHYNLNTTKDILNKIANKLDKYTINNKAYIEK